MSNGKCTYLKPCESMATFYDANERSNNAKGLFSLENFCNFHVSPKFYHMGFFIRGKYTPKGGIMISYCPFCGANLDEGWTQKARREMFVDEHGKPPNDRVRIMPAGTKNAGRIYERNGKRIAMRGAP